MNSATGTDDTGAPVYDPRILLKIILYAYSKGTSSRKIAVCCNDNVIFKALSANTRPHFMTIADFISSHDLETMNLFLEILLICDQEKAFREIISRHKERDETETDMAVIARKAKSAGD